MTSLSSQSEASEIVEVDEGKNSPRKEGEEVEPGASVAAANISAAPKYSKVDVARGGRGRWSTWVIVLVAVVSAASAGYWLDAEKTLSACHFSPSADSGKHYQFLQKDLGQVHNSIPFEYNGQNRLKTEVFDAFHGFVGLDSCARGYLFDRGAGDFGFSLSREMSKRVEVKFLNLIFLCSRPEALSWLVKRMSGECPECGGIHYVQFNHSISLFSRIVFGKKSKLGGEQGLGQGIGVRVQLDKKQFFTLGYHQLVSVTNRMKSVTSKVDNKKDIAVGNAGNSDSGGNTNSQKYQAVVLRQHKFHRYASWAIHGTICVPHEQHNVTVRFRFGSYFFLTPRGLKPATPMDNSVDADNAAETADFVSDQETSELKMFETADTDAPSDAAGCRQFVATGHTTLRTKQTRQLFLVATSSTEGTVIYVDGWYVAMI